MKSGATTRRCALLFVVLMLLAACGEHNDEPRAPTPSASASPTPPPMPELASDDSPAGAEAFVRHYIDVLNYAALTGDTEQLADLSADTCSGCQRYITLFRDIYSGGGYVREESWKVVSAESEKSANGIEVYARTDVSGARFRNSRESPEEVSEPYSELLRFSLQQQSGKWLVYDFVRSES